MRVGTIVLMKECLLDLQNILLHQDLTDFLLDLQHLLLHQVLNYACLDILTGWLLQQHKNALDNSLWLRALTSG